MYDSYSVRLIPWRCVHSENGHRRPGAILERHVLNELRVADRIFLLGAAALPTGPESLRQKQSRDL